MANPTIRFETWLVTEQCLVPALVRGGKTNVSLQELCHFVALIGTNIDKRHAWRLEEMGDAIVPATIRTFALSSHSRCQIASTTLHLSCKPCEASLMTVNHRFGLWNVNGGVRVISCDTLHFSTAKKCKIAGMVPGAVCVCERVRDVVATRARRAPRDASSFIGDHRSS